MPSYNIYLRKKNIESLEKLAEQKGLDRWKLLNRILEDYFNDKNLSSPRA